MNALSNLVHARAEFQHMLSSSPYPSPTQG
jgi:hypothetical protein